MNQQSALSIDDINQLNQHDAQQWFSQCCAAPLWFEGMAKARPFDNKAQLKQTAQQLWLTCNQPGNQHQLLTAFEAHPMIGDVNSLRKKYAATKAIASNEQQGASQASEQTLQTLADANHRYLAKHGFIFIICATGLSADTMLDALLQRIDNTTQREIELAAAEQIKITLLRLDKGLKMENKQTSTTHTMSLSSHVLDTTLGKPAANMPLTLTTHDGTVISGHTDSDGRFKDWGGYAFTEGQYCLRFHTKEYLLAHHQAAFYPFVDVHFELSKNGGHYHVPLLISPFGFSSYRGS